MPDTDLVRSIGKTTVQILAAFAGIPGLAPAVELVCLMIDQLGKLPSHRSSMSQLVDRCHVLLILLKDVYDPGLAPPADISELLKEIESTLGLVEKRIVDLTAKNRLLAFANQETIERDIVECHKRIDFCITHFNLTSHLEILQWHRTFDLTTRRDHAELLGFFSDIQNAQNITNETLNQHTNMLYTIMTLLQNVVSSHKQSQNHKLIHVILSAQSLGDHHDKTTRDGLQVNLYNLQLRSGELLPDLNLQKGEVERVGQYPIGGNPRIDVWEGLYLKSEKVAIKVIRAVESSDKGLERFRREAKIWYHIWKIDQGRHVLPLYGFCQNDGPFPYLVSPWYPNGTAISWVKLNPDLDYKQFIREIAEGVAVLHGCKPPLVHGDLRGENIVISSMGNPLIADFSLSKVVEDISGVPFTQSHGVVDLFRWFAPELLTTNGLISTCSDIYAFGMTVLQLFTHKPPFSNIQGATDIILEVRNGKRPMRPSDEVVTGRGMDDALWNLLQTCWYEEPLKRPTILEVLHELSPE